VVSPPGNASAASTSGPDELDEQAQSPTTSSAAADETIERFLADGSSPFDANMPAPVPILAPAH
jgi:hypothetical protein